MRRLWQCGQCIATKTPLVGRVQRSRTAGRRERSAGKDNRSDDESRAASWRGMPRKKDRYLRALAIFPRRGYIRASAAAMPKTRPRNSARRAALRSLPAFQRSPAGPRRPAIGSTASKREGIAGISLRIGHKTGSLLRAFQPWLFLVETQLPRDRSEPSTGFGRRHREITRAAPRKLCSTRTPEDLHFASHTDFIVPIPAPLHCES
jgi:hypothetical protein